MDFTECEHFGQCDDIDNDLRVLLNNMKWLQIIGWGMLLTMVTIGIFVLERAEASTKLTERQESMAGHIQVLSENVQLLNKNIAETSTITLSVTLDSMKKMHSLESLISKNREIIERHIGETQ